MFEPSVKRLSNGDIEIICAFFTMGHIVRHRDLIIKGCYEFVDGTRTQGSPVKIVLGCDSKWDHFFNLRERPSAQGGKHGIRTLTRKIRNALEVPKGFALGIASWEQVHRAIQQIGRICYGKTESDPTRAKAYFDKLVNSKHFSVLEHISVACMIDAGTQHTPHTWERVVGSVLYTNLRSYMEFGYQGGVLHTPPLRATRLLHLTSEELHTLAITDRTASITAESMRYSIQANGNEEYLKMIESGAKPEDARLLLPTDTIIRVYVTQYVDKI